MNKAELIAYSRQPFNAMDIRPIPRTWPAEIVSSKTMWDWAQSVTAPHQATYTQQGLKAYSAAVMETIFLDEDPLQWNLPASMLNLCAMVDSQIIAQTATLGLSDEQQTVLRERIVGSFLFGRIIVPYLRPDAVRGSEPVQRLSSVDGALFEFGNERLQQLTRVIMEIGKSHAEQPLTDSCAHRR